MNLLLRSNSCASCIKSSITNYPFLLRKLKFSKFIIFSEPSWMWRTNRNCKFKEWFLSELSFLNFQQFHSNMKSFQSIFTVMNSLVQILINMWDFKRQWNELYAMDVFCKLPRPVRKTTSRPQWHESMLMSAQLWCGFNFIIMSGISWSVCKMFGNDGTFSHLWNRFGSLRSNKLSETCLFENRGPLFLLINLEHSRKLRKFPNPNTRR